MKQNTMPRQIKPSDLEREARRLVASGQMPSLETLLQAIAETTAEYRDKILAARREEPNGTDAEG